MHSVLDDVEVHTELVEMSMHDYKEPCTLPLGCWLKQACLHVLGTCMLCSAAQV